MTSPFRTRRRVSIDCSSSPTNPSRVDQSQREQTDINAMVARAQRTGQWPLPQSGRQPVYGDVSNVPSSMLEAFEIVEQASQAFMALPAEIRRSMRNDPANLELWLQDPSNRADAVKHGLLNPPPKPLLDPATASAAEGEDGQPGEGHKPPQGASSKRKPSSRPQESE